MLRQSVKLLVSTGKHMRNANQLLLIPLTVWSGLEQSFLGAQFTKVIKIWVLEDSQLSSLRLGLCLVHSQCEICRSRADCLWRV